MRVSETVQTSIHALWQNKGRTFLTMLGVIIGVFSVVSLVSLVRGVQNYVSDQFDELGSNLLFVYPGSASLTDDPAMFFSNNKLAEKHVDLIQKHLGNQIVGVGPIIMTGRTAKYKTRSFYSVITGADSNHANMTDIELVKGRFFTEAEEKSKAKVAVIGPMVENELFGGINPIGRKLKVDNTSLLVIGVMEEKGEDFDEQIVLPYTTVKDLFDIKQYTYINVKLKSVDEADLMAKKVEITLLRDLKKDEFTIYSQNDLLESIQEILGILAAGLGAVAGISLLVGGIGIMNIMLVSVTERIREIGLRKALGATSFNIGFQFMIESVVISIIGGSIGLGFGWLSTFFAQNWLRAETPIWAVVVAFGFSLLVGVVFGTYPAIQASRMDPINALRYE